MSHHLYKYRSLSSESKKYTERSITHQELYFSHASSFNDPFDCLPTGSLKSTKQEFKEYLTGYFKRRYPHLNRKERIASIKEIMKDPNRNQHSTGANALFDRGIKGVMDLAGVFCLCEDERNLLMWSHYADCHRGLCMRFAVTDDDSFFCEAKKVLYSEKRPVVNIIKDNEEEIGIKTLLTKAKCWEYEQEWRMVSPKRKPGVHRYNPSQLTGIIIGAKASKDDIADIRKWVGQLKHPVELFQAKINETNYSLDIIIA